jgi:hypothetical protein
MAASNDATGDDEGRNGMSSKQSCALCQAPLPPAAATGRPRRYCSEECRRTADETRRERGRVKAISHCVVCGEELAQPKEGGSRKYCSAVCRNWYGCATPLSNPGYVYVFDTYQGYKIGRSTSVPRRRKEIDRYAPIMKTIATDNMVRLEWQMHQRFAAQRTHGEYFALTDDDLDWITALPDTLPGGIARL